MGSYIPNTGKEQLEMLKSMGYSSMDDLFAAIPDDMKLKDGLDLPEGKSELEVSRVMAEMAGKNTIFPSIFRGAGAYDHYIPAIVKSVTSKEEFLTSYTPYQAEISQGVLQSIFEYQTMICEITGMDAVTLQPAAGAHGEFLGLLLIKAYHHSQGDTGRQARRRWRRWAFSSGERGSSTVSTPPMPTTSPYWTGAEPSTGLPFTVTPPLEPRS